MNKQQRAWAFYDWANSAYPLVISTAVFPLYFEWVAPETLKIFGDNSKPLSSTVVYSYVLSASFLTVAFLLPILGGIADKMQNKKVFMQAFLILGTLSCTGLFFFTSNNTAWGLLMSYMASVGFWGSLVFYNAYLPEIAEREKQDAVSAYGYSLGYLGSSILLIICLIFIQLQATDEAKQMAFRISFALVAVWWFGFAQITLKKLPSDSAKVKFNYAHLWKLGFERLQQTYKQLQKLDGSLRFLLSYFFFSIGVQTIILIAGLYGASELKLERTQLIFTILIIQFVAIAGAQIFSFLSRKLGNIQALMLSLLVWVVVCLMAYLLSPNDPQVYIKFFITAALVGLVLGGTQSLSRSTFSKLLPEDEPEHTAYFSFMDVTEKLSIVIGTSLFGLVTQMGNMRLGALALSVFFVLGIFILLSLRRKAVWRPV